MRRLNQAGPLQGVCAIGQRTRAHCQRSTFEQVRCFSGLRPVSVLQSHLQLFLVVGQIAPENTLQVRLGTVRGLVRRLQ